MLHWTRKGYTVQYPWTEWTEWCSSQATSDVKIELTEIVFFPEPSTAGMETVPIKAMASQTKFVQQLKTNSKKMLVYVVGDFPVQGKFKRDGTWEQKYYVPRW